MLARLFTLLVAIASVYSFTPSFGRVSKQQMSMNMQNHVAKAMGIALVGLSLIAPEMPAMADGAVSKSTVFRARNTYGRRIQELKEAAVKGDFAAFEDKKAVNSFDLFISGSNALNSKADKELKKAETAVESQLYAAVKAKDASKLKSTYSEFIKVADLTEDFKPDERGQTDSSGYSPTWGTSKQYIYQR